MAGKPRGCKCKYVEEYGFSLDFRGLVETGKRCEYCGRLKPGPKPKDQKETIYTLDSVKNG